jgi:ADP-ribose pyrophosphatase YjhB (NUDIX family)
MSEDKISKEIESKFGHHLRIRVNGVMIEENKILLVKHKMSADRDFWSTPGGGMQFGSSAQENLVREFLEETGLEITVGEFLFVHEYLDPPLHAIECFFRVKRISGTATLGKDPELGASDQILAEISWMTVDGLNSLDKKSIHPVFLGIKSLEELVLCKGYFNFENKYLK